MERTNVQKLARVLRVLVLLVLACNLVCLLLVPGIAGLLAQGGPGQLRLWGNTCPQGPQRAMGCIMWAMCSCSLPGAGSGFGPMLPPQRSPYFSGCAGSVPQ